MPKSKVLTMRLPALTDRTARDPLIAVPGQVLESKLLAFQDQLNQELAEGLILDQLTIVDHGAFVVYLAILKDQYSFSMGRTHVTTGRGPEKLLADLMGAREGGTLRASSDEPHITNPSQAAEVHPIGTAEPPFRYLCQNCGRVFYAPDRTLVVGMRKHFCSQKCHAEWHADVTAGRRKPNLVPGGEIPAGNGPHQTDMLSARPPDL